MRHTVCFVLLALALLAAPAWGAENVYNQVNDAVRAQSDGNLSRAFELYTSIIDSGELRSDPKILAYLHNNRAVIWLQQGSEGMAMEDFQRALELYPDHTTYYNRALILVDRGRPQEALVDLNKAIAMFPEYGNAYELRGQLMMEAGNPVQGRADMEKAAELKLRIHFLGPGEYTAGAQPYVPKQAGEQGLRERRRVE